MAGKKDIVFGIRSNLNSDSPLQAADAVSDGSSYVITCTYDARLQEAKVRATSASGDSTEGVYRFSWTASWWRAPQSTSSSI